MATTTKKVHENNYYHGYFLPVARSLAGAMLLLSFHSYAGDWKITPSVNLKETYSDNVRLATPGNEKSDFITQINPGISVSGTGSHLKLDGSYTMQNIFYANDNGPNSIRHQLSAHGNVELLDDLFFVDGKASISQQNISAFGPQTTDNTNVTGNLSNVTTYSISPYLRHRFKNFASAEARFTHDSVSTGTNGLSDSQSDRILLNLTSGTEFGRLGWGLHYNKQQIDFTNRPTVDLETYSGDLRYRVTPQFSLTATGGEEKNNYLSLSGNSGGTFWTGGFEWNPSQRTSISANAGQRFFGNTYSLKADHRSRRTLWSVSYSEDITTTRDQFLIPASIDTAGFLVRSHLFDFLPEAERLAAAEAFIKFNGLPIALAENINFFTNRFFLQKRLQASVSVSGTRNTIVLSFFDTSREAQTSRAADSLLLGSSSSLLNDSTNSVGVNALWNLRISPQTSANLSAGFTRITSDATNRQDDLKTLRVSLTKQFQPKLNGMIELRRNERDSNQTNGAYSENAITASVNMNF